MTFDEYMENEPPEDQDLPSTFLSDEDLPGNTNVLIIPNYKINLELILDEYVEALTKAKTKADLKDVLECIWHHAEKHGQLTEKLDRIQMDLETLQLNLLMEQGYEIEIVDEDE